MTATIMLAKGYEPSKLVFPVMVSEKLDGVPAKIYIGIRDMPGKFVGPTVQTPMEPMLRWSAQTRQGNPYPSIHAQCEALGESLMNMGCKGVFTFIAEVTHKDRTIPFKDAGGMCRAQKQCDDLILNIFDFYRPTEDGPDTLPFGKRILLAARLISPLGMHWCRMIPQLMCADEFALARGLSITKAFRELDGFLPEGAIIRNCNDKWVEGKRG